MRLKYYLLSFFFLSILALSCGFSNGYWRRVSIIAIDTVTLKQRTYNSAPNGYKYREVFLAKEDANTFWGALRRADGGVYYNPL